MNRLEIGGSEQMDIKLSAKLISEAEAILEEDNGIPGPVGIPSRGDEINAILSPDPKDLIPLHVIEYRGVEYFLGLPKDEG